MDHAISIEMLGSLFSVCKVSMDGGPTDVNAVNLQFVAN